MSVEVNLKYYVSSFLKRKRFVFFTFPISFSKQRAKCLERLVLGIGGECMRQ